MTEDLISPRIDPALLDRYLAGEATSEERERVQKWAESHPERGGILHAAQGIQPGVMRTVKEPDVEAKVISIMDNVGTLPRVRISRRYEYLGVPLAIVAAIAIGFFAIKYLPNITTTKSTRATPQTKTYTTLPGQRANITLADGSIVNLGPATTMHVTGVAGRNVDLQGEAIFTVTQHTNNPFTVKAGNTITRVLGTTFGVRAYDENVRVAVKDGRVSVGNQVLDNNDIANVNSGAITVIRDTNVTAAFALTTGRLVFNHTPFAQAVPDLNRWFDADIRIADTSLAWQPLVGTFPAGTRADLAATLEALLGARVVRDGRIITVYR